MSNRPTGQVSGHPMQVALAHVYGRQRRDQVSREIREQFCATRETSELPSVHLSWGLQQMKLRGWRNDDWGQLFTDPYYTKLGDGPVCLLEACHGYMDSPGALANESPEQYYLRLAFVALGWDVPVYVSDWNDEQDSFAPIETVVLKAIELAEADEQVGAKPYEGASQEELAARFGLTEELLARARAEQAHPPTT